MSKFNIDRLSTLSADEQRNYLMNLPTHLSSSKQLQRLIDAIWQFEFLEAKLDVADTNALIADFDLLPDSNAAEPLRSALKMSAHALAQDKTQLAAQLLGRLLQHSQGYSLKQERSPLDVLLTAAQNPSANTLLPLHPSLDVAGGALTRTMTNAGAVYAQAISKDGRIAFIASSASKLNIWNTETGELLKTIPCSSVRAIAVTSNGQLLVFAEKNVLKLLDVTAEREVWLRTDHRGWVRSIAISSNGEYICTGADDCAVRIWELRTGRPLKELRGHTERVNTVTFTPDGKFIISGAGDSQGTDSTIKVWDIELEEAVYSFQKHTGDVSAVAVTPNGDQLVSVDLNAGVKIWDLRSRTLLRELYFGDEWIKALAVSPRGDRMILGTDGGLLRVLELPSANQLETIDAHELEVTALAITSDARRLVSASYDATIKVWNLQAAAETDIRVKHVGEVTAVALAQDETLAFSGGKDGVINIWDVKTGQIRSRIPITKTAIHKLLALPANAGVISASADAVILWDIESGAPIRKYGDGGCSIAVLADRGTRLITSASEIMVWEIDNGLPLVRIPVQSLLLEAATNGSVIAASDSDNRVSIWNITSGTKIYELQNDTTDSIKAITVSDSGRYVAIAAGSFTRLVSIHNDVADSTVIEQVYDSAVSTLRFTHDESAILVGTAGRRIYVSRLDSQSNLALTLLNDGWEDINLISQFKDSQRFLTVTWGGSVLNVLALDTGTTSGTFTADGLFFRPTLDVQRSVVLAGDNAGHVYLLRQYITSG